LQNDFNENTSAMLDSDLINAKIEEIEKKLAAEKPKTENKKFRLPLKAYLMYLIVATLLFTGVSLSKYAISAGGEDGAGVAKVYFSSDMDEDYNLNITAAPGNEADEDATFELQLFNKTNAIISEVDLSYSVKIENLTNNLPLTFKFYRKEANSTLTLLDSTENTVTGKFEAGADASITYVIKIIWDEVPPESASYEVDSIRVTVTSEQDD